MRFIFCFVCQLRAIIIEGSWAIFGWKQHTGDISATLSFHEFHIPSVSFHFFCLDLHRVISSKHHQTTVVEWSRPFQRVGSSRRAIVATPDTRYYGVMRRLSFRPLRNWMEVFSVTISRMKTRFKSREVCPSLCSRSCCGADKEGLSAEPKAGGSLLAAGMRQLPHLSLCSSSDSTHTLEIKLWHFTQAASGRKGIIYWIWIGLSCFWLFHVLEGGSGFSFFYYLRWNCCVSVLICRILLY